MPIVVAKKLARKVVRSSRPKAATKLCAVDENGRFILGYASHVARVRPGVDLTEPTLAPGEFFQ